MRSPDSEPALFCSRADPRASTSGAQGEERKVAQARAAFQAALSDAKTSDSNARPSARFGDYELLNPLDRGATATVYRARQVSLNRLVALKVMHEADRASPAELQRFRFGAEAAAALDHPNIAAIYQVGEHDGVPFFAMRLFEGGTLAQARDRLRQSQVGVVKLMAKVARAVHHAHERGVLHRDLKPANIVLDEHDEPFVVDFGFAKHLDERALTSKPSGVIGTLGYMAPEQAAGTSRSLTFASDIYALGVILYELLTGEVPFQELPLSELVGRLTSAEPVPSPRLIDSSIDRQLESVCRKCLEKDSRHRYGSADELAKDLERWLRHEPVTSASASSVARTFRWCRRHPALAFTLVGAVCVLAATAQVAIFVAREQVQALLGVILEGNSDAARANARQVLFQLQALSYPLARCASDVRVAELLSRGPRESPVHPDRLLVECGAKSLFDSVAIVSRAGEERARLPRRAAPTARADVLGRDYFAGAKRLAESDSRSVYVGRVLRSEDDGAYQVSLSAPIFDTDNHWLGLVHVSINMKAFLDSLELSDSDRRMVLLVGVREPEAGDASEANESGVMVLFHDKLENERGVSDTGAWLKELTRLKRQAPARDPFRSSTPSLSPEDNPQAFPVRAFGNRWLAGFAPVGHTGYAVVVQTQYDATLELLQRAIQRLIGLPGAMLVLGACAVVALAWLLGRRLRVARS